MASVLRLVGLHLIRGKRDWMREVIGARSNANPGISFDDVVLHKKPDTAASLQSNVTLRRLLTPRSQDLNPCV
jgi:hypothetical protein